MQAEFQYHVTKEEQQKELAQIESARKNPSLFQPLYNKYYEPIFRFVYQRVENKDDAADITADVFVKAMTHLNKYEYRGLPFSSWLYRIANNAIVQSARENNKIRSVNAEAWQISDVINELQQENNDKYYDKMLEVIAALQEEDLQFIEMRFFENRSFREIGEIFDITENNAKVKLYRLLEKIKKMITSEK